MTIIHSNIYLYKLLNAVHVQPTMSNRWGYSNAKDIMKADLDRKWKEVTDTLGNLDWKALPPDRQWAAIMVHHPTRHCAEHTLTVEQFMEKASVLYIVNNNGHSPTWTANHPFP
jgi:hypothetical protein